MRKYIVCFCLAVSIFSVTASAEFDADDSSNLSYIKGYLTYAGDSVAESLYNIANDTEYLKNISNNTNLLQYLGFSGTNTMKSEFDAIQSLIGSGTTAYPTIFSALTRINTSVQDGNSIVDKIGVSLTSTDTGSVFYELQQIRIYQKYLANTTTVGLYRLDENGNRYKVQDISSNILGWVGQIYSQLTWDGVNPHTNDKTFYGLLAQMQRVLASDDDLALAESQEANRNQIEDTFLSGESSGTSLGVGDFQNLNSVGSEVTDLFSLGGTASIDGFVSGFSDAESVGSGWFSAATQSQLDTVPTTFALGDPYNMAGWESNYEWVLGGDFE